MSSHNARRTMTEPGAIEFFHGENALLDNYYPCAIPIEGEIYPTAEHAFQAFKTDDPEERLLVGLAITPAAAKSAGQRVSLQPDWEMVKFAAMERVLRIKFSHPDLAAILLKTGDRELMEGNTWGDYLGLRP